MVSSPTASTKPRNRDASPQSAGPVAMPPAARRRSIPFWMLADAFGTDDEEFAPEPDYADFVCWTPFH